MIRKRTILLALQCILMLALSLSCSSEEYIDSTEISPLTNSNENPTFTEIPPQSSSTPENPVTQDIHAVAGAPGLGDSLYPQMGNGGYDVQHYTLALDINDVETSDLCGITTIEAIPQQDLSSFNLDFLGFTIEDIFVNDIPAVYTRSGQELTITPAYPLEADTVFQAEISYCGIPEELASVALPEGDSVGWVVTDTGSFVLGQPDGAANYYPVNDHPLDKATYTIRVTVPQPYEVVANGLLSEEIAEGNASIYVWEVSDPMASYLLTINIGEFDLETMQASTGIPIRNYYSTSLSKDYREPFSRQPEMLSLFSTLFGPYPFDVYGSVLVDAKTGSALETQTMSIYGVDQIDLDDIDTSEELVAHELAHQWFGNSVSINDWSEIWLNEGLATYAEVLWVEHIDGAEARDEYIIWLYEEVVDDYEDMVQPGNPQASDLFNQGIYYRGALTQHALRLEVGDEIYFNVLQTYSERFKNSNVSTADFIAVAEEISGKSLTSFFEDWLYADSLPAIPSLDLWME